MRKNFRTNAGDVASNFLHCGDSVRSVLDSRHTGKVLSIHWGTAKVRWDDYGWISEEQVGDLLTVDSPRYDYKLKRLDV